MAPSDNETDRLPSAMTRWEDLTDNEKTAVRSWQGADHNVPARRSAASPPSASPTVANRKAAHPRRPRSLPNKAYRRPPEMSTAPPRHGHQDRATAARKETAALQPPPAGRNLKAAGGPRRPVRRGTSRRAKTGEQGERRQLAGNPAARQQAPSAQTPVGGAPRRSARSAMSHIIKRDRRGQFRFTDVGIPCESYGDCHVWRHSSVSDRRVFGPPTIASERPRANR